MKPLAQRLQRVILALLGIYLFVYPFGMLLLIFDMVPDWGVWMGGALLILQGSMMALWLTAIYGQRGLLATVLILVMSWAVEHIGVITGFPFGTYHYTDVLLPKLAGVVPLAIPFAWLLVVPTSVGVIEHLIQRRQPAPQPSATNYWYSLSPSLWLKVLGSASFVLLLDITIEPVAVHVHNYWVWSSSGSGDFYGVPISNFIAWWCTSVVLVWILLVITRQPYTSAPHLILPWLPSLLYVLNLTMFVVVNAAHGKIIAAAIGGLILLYLASNGLEPRILWRWIQRPQRGKGS